MSDINDKAFEHDIDSSDIIGSDLAMLTKGQLKDLEKKEKTTADRLKEIIILILPIICSFVALAEYILIPDNSRNNNPLSYIYFLIIIIAIYIFCLIVSIWQMYLHKNQFYEKIYYKAPHISALFLFLAIYDYLTLKTGILTQPFVPCMNHIINAFLLDYEMLIDCTLNTLKLLLFGYFIGISLGLITGITCGYSKRARYWIDPIIKFLGPIPTGRSDISLGRCCIYHRSWIMVRCDSSFTDWYIQCRYRIFRSSKDTWC